MNDSPMDSWLMEWAGVWRVRGLVGRVQVEPGRRLRSSLGRCEPASGKVRIHPALFEPENAELFREVACHEAAHVATYLLHGRNVRPHGREWKSLIVAAGYPPTARMNPARLSESLQERLQPRVSYRHRCLGCGATRVARRRFKRWRCRTCYEAGLNGKMQIVRLTSSVAKAQDHP